MDRPIQTATTDSPALPPVTCESSRRKDWFISAADEYLLRQVGALADRKMDEYQAYCAKSA